MMTIVIKSDDCCLGTFYTRSPVTLVAGVGFLPLLLQPMPKYKETLRTRGPRFST